MSKFIYRAKAKLADRLTRCECCGYPISERHHLFAVAVFGESQHTRQLCANCHELYHLIESVVDMPNRNDVTRAKLLLGQLVSIWGEDDPRLIYLSSLVRYAREARPAALQAFGFRQLGLSMATYDNPPTKPTIDMPQEEYRLMTLVIPQAIGEKLLAAVLDGALEPFMTVEQNWELIRALQRGLAV